MCGTMRSYLWIGVCLLTCPVSFGQSLSIGGIGGGTATNDLSNQWVTDVSARYMIGPTLDIGLPFGFGFEADALYRHETYQATFIPVPQQHVTSWEFPLLLRKTLPFPLIKPFVEGGYAPRALQGGSLMSPYPSASHGIVIGGGVGLGIGRLRLSPVLRYTHWNNSPAVLIYSDGPTISLTQNQVDLLLGVSWRIR